MDDLKFYEEVLDMMYGDDDKYIVEVFIDRMKNYFKNYDTQDIDSFSLLIDVVNNIDTSKLSLNFITETEFEFLEGHSSDRILDMVREHSLSGISKIALRLYIENLLEIYGLYHHVFEHETLKVLVAKKNCRNFEELSEIDKKCLKHVTRNIAGSFSLGGIINPNLYTFCPWRWISREILCSSTLPLESSDGYYIELCNSTYMVVDSITVNNCREDSMDDVIDFNFSRWQRAEEIVDWLNTTKAPIGIIKKLTEKKRYRG